MIDPIENYGCYRELYDDPNEYWTDEDYSNHQEDFHMYAELQKALLIKERRERSKYHRLYRYKDGETYKIAMKDIPFEEDWTEVEGVLSISFIDYMDSADYWYIEMKEDSDTYYYKLYTYVQIGSSFLFNKKNLHKTQKQEFI